MEVYIALNESKFQKQDIDKEEFEQKQVTKKLRVSDSEITLKPRVVNGIFWYRRIYRNNTDTELGLGQSLTLFVQGFWMMIKYWSGGNCAHNFKISQNQCKTNINSVLFRLITQRSGKCALSSNIMIWKLVYCLQQIPYYFDFR